ncbi:MAG: CRISPR-associated endonuclease Cas2 [Chloroflexota bacterium]|mgnify:CR=1 FL=1
MFAVVCYDIPDDRRRTKIGKILEGYGSRVQWSVFECDLTEKQMQKLKERLAKVTGKEDTLRYYHLCAGCVLKVEVVNGPPVTASQSYFVV